MNINNLREKVVDYAMENGVDDLTSFEIEFIETMDNLNENVSLSPKQIDILREIANKLGLL